MARPTRSWLCSAYPKASSTDAVTGLSYTAIQAACASWYQVIQVSPQTPVVSLRPQQPTCRDGVLPSRAALRADFHRFKQNRVSTVTCAPVSVSPNPTRLASGWIGSKDALQHPAPVIAQRAQLRALRFGSSDPLSWRDNGLR